MNRRRLFAVLMLFSFIPSPALAVTASATAIIVKPLSITKLQDLEFGTIAVGAGGTVTIGPSGARTSEGVILSSLLPGAAASFVISGEENSSYELTLPEEVALTDGSGNTMIASGFTTDLATPKLDEAGRQTLRIGTTLRVNPDLPPGAYSGNFLVTVNYN